MRAAARNWFLGPAPLSDLTITHCVHSCAEVLFTVSLAGSIFFSVSAEAARPRVLLYLVLTLLPFLVMAPLVGPRLDRVRGGAATVLVATFVLRSALMLVLAENLLTLLLFPLAFGVLVVAKSYSVALNTVVPSLVDDEEELVSANARLARTSTILKGFAAIGAVWFYAVTSGPATLRLASAVYLVGAVVAWRVRRTARPMAPAKRVTFSQIAMPDVSGAVQDMMVLRSALGFALFEFGFALRADALPAWILGALIFASGAGGFTGTLLSPWLRARMAERSMFTIALFASSSATLACALVLTPVWLVGAMFVIGLGASIGRRALDATIQRQAPKAQRGRVYAGLEVKLEMAWAAAACVAVGARIATWIGVLGLAIFLLLAALAHLRRPGGRGVIRPLAATPVQQRLLTRAETLFDHDLYDEAVVIALSALGPSASGAVRAGPSLEEIYTGGASVDRADAERVLDAVRVELAEAAALEDSPDSEAPRGRRGPA